MKIFCSHSNILAITVSLVFILPTQAQQRIEADSRSTSGPPATSRVDTYKLDMERKRAVQERTRLKAQRERKPIIGVLLASDEKAGVPVVGVTPGSTADDAGLRSGDRLLAVSGNQIIGSSGTLRVGNARKLLGKLETATPVRITYLRDGKTAVATVTPKIGDRVVVLRGLTADSRIEKRVRPGEDGGQVFAFEADNVDGMIAPHASSQIHKEIIRLGPAGECKGTDCRTPMLMSAFRWNGLNLASLDPQLGRYFGTDKGVLVLSTGELKGLQSGDVIQSVEGKAVDSPREVMAALRGKPANASVAVGYLRDRTPGKTTITVPSVLRRLPSPPAPPAPPSPPSAPKAPMPPAPPRATGFAVPPAPPAAFAGEGLVFMSGEDHAPE